VPDCRDRVAREELKKSDVDVVIGRARLPHLPAILYQVATGNARAAGSRAPDPRFFDEQDGVRIHRPG